MGRRAGQAGMAEGKQWNPPQQGHDLVRATLFGRFELRASDGSEVVISNRRARAVLAMLCLAKGETIDREFLSKLLWPGRFEAHAKASLRQCLLELGKLLASCGKDVLEVSRTSVALRRDTIGTDLDALEDALARADFTAATAKLVAIGTKPILDSGLAGTAPMPRTGWAAPWNEHWASSSKLATASRKRTSLVPGRCASMMALPTRRQAGLRPGRGSRCCPFTRSAWAMSRIISPMESSMS
jgi:hypothetical protein